MPENNEFWRFYWETRLLPMENLGKRQAILAASGLIRDLAQQVGYPLRLLELGCGEGSGYRYAAGCPFSIVHRADFSGRGLQCSIFGELPRRDFPGFRCVEGDFTAPNLLDSLGKFDIILLVNALHEVFSDSFSRELGEIDIPVAKQRVEHALGGAAGCLNPGGWLVLFDGLEPPGDPRQSLRIRFRDEAIREDFETFVQQYHPLRITYREVEDPLCVELSQRDFTRYITKSIFLRKKLWKTEQLESYQYFTEQEHRSAFARQGLEISELRTLTVNDQKWHRLVEIETPGVAFPEEHVLIVARKRGKN